MAKKPKTPPDDSSQKENTAQKKTGELTRQQRIDLMPMLPPDHPIYSSGFVLGSMIVIKHEPDGDEDEK